MQSWLLCLQTPYDSIKYITNDLSSPAYMPYYKFLDYITNIIKIGFFEDFKDQLDKFSTILVNLDTHEWELYDEEKDVIGFKQLFDFNEKMNEEKQNRKSRFKDIDSKKNFINGIAHKKTKFKYSVVNFHDPFFRREGK